MTPFRPSGPVRSRLYGLLWRTADVCFRCGNACGHVAAGLLRRDDLRAASRLQWQDYATTDDEVDAGLTQFEQRLFSRWLRPGARVLLIGSGAGRDLIGLCRLGYAPTGIEPVPGLVERCRRNLARHGVAASVVLDAVETAPLDQYDAVIWSSFCYSLVHPASTRVETLARLRGCLPSGGRMLVGSITFRSQSRVSIWLAQLSARLASADWLPESGDAFTRVHLSPGLLKFEHAFRPGEVERECASAGLRLVGEEICDARTRYVVAEVDTLARPFAQS